MIDQCENYVSVHVDYVYQNPFYIYNFLVSLLIGIVNIDLFILVRKIFIKYYIATYFK